jgi:protein TonB
MKPETILQKDILDILFENRNKDYGAYNLRKNYPTRLLKALGFTFAFVFVVSVWYVKANSTKDKVNFYAGKPVTDIYLKALDEPQKPKIIEKAKAIRKKLVAQIQHTEIKIVPDKEVDKPIAENKELENKEISTLTKGGLEAVEGEILPAPPEAADNGKIIEREKEVREEEVAPLTHADVMPVFPGGNEAFRKFMLRNLREPTDLEEGEKIVVIIKFIVEADGSIENAEVLKSGGRFDEEVLRVVKKMPKWKPGVKNGKYVSVYFNLPVTFAGSE